LLLVGPIDVNASIYKCTVNGKTVFRDKPCEEGQGKKFNLGAVVENNDPTGTLGSISGSWKEQGRSVSIRDALAILDRKTNLLSLYLIPDRFTAAEVEKFQETADESILQKKPSVILQGYSGYPYLNVRISFKTGLPRNQKNIDSIELVSHGFAVEASNILRIEQAGVAEVVQYMTLFEDISYGDINLDSEGAQDEMNWKISIKAPIYYHALQ